MFTALRNLAEAGLPSEVLGEIRTGADAAVNLLVDLVEGGGDPHGLPNTNELSTAERLSRNPKVSADLLLYVAQGFADSRVLQSTIGQPEESILHRVSVAEAVLRRYFEREADRLMARHSIGSDAVFDPVSLVFVLRGLLLLSPPEFRQTAFFRACVGAVIGGQNDDGTWPDGVSALEDEGRATLQHPSAKIAVTLADVVFDLSMLVRASPNEIETLELSMPALRRMADHLSSSYYAGDTTNPTTGWVSDRVRWPQTSDMWINALAAQLFLRMYFASEAVRRARILAEFRTQWPKESGKDPSSRLSAWSGSIIEPDGITKPCAEIMHRIIEPIVEEQQRRLAIVRPAESGVSAILYGPPGSGKTYLVKELASALNWPLVELNPGTFLSEGLDFIEYRARHIFETLMGLKHAVVFFDECDELLLDRDQQDSRNRNVLSFVTACMLPKLQELHDARSVVFVVATNYIARIDKAIRRPGRFDLLLLFDRPDEAARRRIFERAWTGSANTGSPEDVARAVIATDGLTMPEILSHAKRGDRAAQLVQGTRDDYLDWCSLKGESELESGQMDKETREKVSRRWKSIPGYVDALKSRKPLI